MAQIKDIREALDFVTEGDPTASADIRSAINERLYGPYMAAMVRHGAKRLQQGITTREILLEALGAVSRLNQAGARIYADSFGRIPDEDLERHQRNVLNGDVIDLPSMYWSTKEEGRKMAEFASETLDGISSAARVEITSLNYGAMFTDNTMAGWQRTLRTSPEELLSRQGYEGMPHIGIFNWAIGGSVATVVQRAAEMGKKVQIIDIGSGDGSTPAAIVKSINDLELEHLPKISFTALEATREFFDGLLRFAQSEQGAARLGLTPVSTSVNEVNGRPISEIGKLTCVYGDAVEAVNRGVLIDDPDTITIVTANLSLHRIPPKAKARLFGALGKLDNVVVAIGDQWTNGSQTNVSYWNHAFNGPQNPANIGLAEMLERQFGYQMSDVRDGLPTAIRPDIAERIASGWVYDIGYIAGTRGPLAREALPLQEVAIPQGVDPVASLPTPLTGSSFTLPGG